MTHLPCVVEIKHVYRVCTRVHEHWYWQEEGLFSPPMCIRWPTALICYDSMQTQYDVKG